MAVSPLYCPWRAGLILPGREGMGGFNDDPTEGFISNSRIWIIIKPDDFFELEVRQHGVLEREGGWL